MFVKGRYPVPTGVMNDGNLGKNIEYFYRNGMVVRLDDAKNPSFWLEVHVERSEIESWLRQMDAAPFQSSGVQG